MSRGNAPISAADLSRCQECIASEKCQEAAKDEQRVAVACEKQQACDEKGYLGNLEEKCWESGFGSEDDVDFI